MSQDTIFNLLMSTEEGRAGKDTRNRLNSFQEWVNDSHPDLGNPDWMRQYDKYLEQERGLSKSSRQAYLSTLRSQFRTMLEDSSLKEDLIQAGVSAIEAELLIGRLWQALNTKRVKIKSENTKARNLNLTDEHGQQLLDKPDLTKLKGRRDLLVIALMLIFGLREHEVCALNVEDFYGRFQGEPMLHVPDGYGCTERDLPYGPYERVQELATDWFQRVGIEEGPAIRGFYKSGWTIRKNRLSPRAVDRLLANYRIIINEQKVALKPLDLRHAYARHQYGMGVPVDTIRKNLGLKTLPPVIDYLGNALDDFVPSRSYDLYF